jgi:hypothetical protein
MHKEYGSKGATAKRTESEIPVYTAEPQTRSYQEMAHYEAVGSNITSFDRVLARIKNQARRDGCQALVKVKFYRQPIGSGRKPATFPKIQAIGIRFTDREDLANN